MLFLIREMLLTEYGKGQIKLLEGKQDKVAARDCDMFNCKAMPDSKSCHYCGVRGDISKDAWAKKQAEFKKSMEEKKKK
jgi:hypothetical protein